MSSPRQNLELKVRLKDPSAARETLASLGAPDGGIEVQTDTYFVVPRGRLKLREIQGQPSVLIAYDRPADDRARMSSYRLVPVGDVHGLKAALSSALGLRGVVRKRREIHFWHNVRIHFDEVEGLGSFLEFEAVLSRDDDAAISSRRLEELSQRLSISSSEAIGGSYADLLGI